MAQTTNSHHITEQLLLSLIVVIAVDVITIAQFRSKVSKDPWGK